MIRTLLVLCLALGVTIPVVAAQPAPAANRRETIKKKIRALRAYALTEELGLDEKAAGKLFPVLAKWDDVTDKLLVQRVDLTRQLRAVDQIKDPRAVDKLIDDAVANQRAFWDLEDKRLVELRKILSPAQVARLLIVLPEFERKIQNQLRRAIQKRAGGAGGGTRNRNRNRGGDDDGADDLDDDDEAEDLRVPQAPRSAPPKQATPPAANAAKCDPFSTVHGCPPNQR
ncbi:MAG: hypothetical protein IPQ07_32060 [Myxococcales bacterium]|nr:hypothetical protein [Myxococcales bacterium]